jgi:amidase
MNGTGPISKSSCPALAVPAGFNEQGLPMGIQIVGPTRAELQLLLLAYGYDATTRWPAGRLSPLLGH